MTDNIFQRFSDRFFRVSPLYTRPGWYIKLRNGEVLGPFPSKQAAQLAIFELFGIPPVVSEGMAVQGATPSRYEAEDSRGAGAK